MSTNASGNTGPLGQPRGIGFGILMYIITLWTSTAGTGSTRPRRRSKQHTGDGLGGVLGLVVWIVIGAVSAFVIPSEIGRMYQRDGQHPPVTGWTGLWLFPGAILIIPAIVWFVKMQGSLNTYWGAKMSSGAAAAPAEA